MLLLAPSMIVRRVARDDVDLVAVLVHRDRRGAIAAVHRRETVAETVDHRDFARGTSDLDSVGRLIDSQIARTQALEG